VRTPGHSPSKTPTPRSIARLQKSDSILTPRSIARLQKSDSILPLIIREKKRKHHQAAGVKS